MNEITLLSLVSTGMLIYQTNLAFADSFLLSHCRADGMKD